ncbi:MAG: ABC transporter permease [Desulfobacter sp.]|nr:MAG: ABC transporter permease [Desulfobacter sp.]
METLRSRLLQDPRNREIRPMVSRSFTPDWLERLQTDPRVDFLVPTTRSISASVQLKSKTGKLSLEAQPTALNDPLLIENNAAPPLDGQCVVSTETARKLKAGTGDKIQLIVKRLKGSQFETGQTRLTISGVLDPRATARDLVYFPLSLLEDIEGFKDGQAVSKFGWKGAVPLAKPVYDGVVVGLDTPMDPVLKVKLISGTGLSRVEKLAQDRQLNTLGYTLTHKKHIYIISTQNALGKEVLTTAGRRLRGKNALVLPWVKPTQIMLGNKAMTLFALPHTLESDTPWAQNLPMGPGWRQTILPKDFKIKPEDQLVSDSGLSIPVIPQHPLVSREGQVLVPPELAGILNLSQRRQISWLDREDKFILKRRGYAAFRLYAKTLEDVAPLKETFEAQGIPVHTEAERIRDIQALDQNLGMIFWLIAIGGVLDGAGSLTASLYASVERKRRDLGVLGLIGFGQNALLSFPLFQAFFLSMGGLILASGFYMGMAGLINQLFSSQLAAGESVCRLGWDHLAYAASGVIFLGQTATALAAFRVITIDPAEALRDE